MDLEVVGLVSISSGDFHSQKAFIHVHDCLNQNLSRIRDYLNSQNASHSFILNI
jgi:hypothetical protein